MLDNEKIIGCDWSEDGGILEYDISHLHPELGVLIQEYRISSMNYEGKRIYQSDFSLSGSSSSEVGDFSHLPKEAKEELWAVVFMVANVFFAEYQPDIVEHFIDGAYLLEKRYERYRTQLRPPRYDIELDKIKRTITYQKEEKGPTVNGGPSVFNQILPTLAAPAASPA